MNKACFWPCKILLVDDNRIIRHLLRLTFANDERFIIFEAENSEEALLIVEHEHPEVIILDVMMPGGISGFEVCQLVKSKEETRFCKIILLSARGQQDDLAQGQEAGADLYIVKPFSPSVLIRQVEELLSRI
jgi:DNA-binding response OmpR family regulator